MHLSAIQKGGPCMNCVANWGITQEDPRGSILLSARVSGRITRRLAVFVQVDENSLDWNREIGWTQTAKTCCIPGAAGTTAVNATRLRGSRVSALSATNLLHDLVSWDR